MNKKYCKCGCGEEIIVKLHHKYYGIPDFIRGHNSRIRPGVPHKEATKRKISQTKKRLYAAGILKLSGVAQKGESNWSRINGAWNKELTKETDERVRKYASAERTPEWRNKQSEGLKRAWVDENSKLGSEETIQKRLISLLKRPTSYEDKIDKLCAKYNLPFIYTGDGSFLIGSKNPDFINMDKKLAIEVYYSWFKVRNNGSCEEYERQRSEYFGTYGWDVVFITENEIENKNWEISCLSKIKGALDG